eukprot:363593-Chlamydomonas_euryale.AAC.5
MTGIVAALPVHLVVTPILAHPVLPGLRPGATVPCTRAGVAFRLARISVAFIGYEMQQGLQLRWCNGHYRPRHWPFFEEPVGASMRITGIGPNLSMPVSLEPL